MKDYKRTLSFIIIVSTLLALPVSIFAQESTPTSPAFSTSWFDTLIADFGLLVVSTTSVLIALAFFVFLWGVVKFISASGNEAVAQEGKQKMVWGVLALFTITAIWGILALLRTITGVGDKNESNYPKWRGTTTP